MDGFTHNAYPLVDAHLAVEAIYGGGVPSGVPYNMTVYHFRAKLSAMMVANYFFMGLKWLTGLTGMAYDGYLNLRDLTVYSYLCSLWLMMLVKNDSIMDDNMMVNTSGE